MPNNKYINKVVINDTTLLDLTEDSVTPKTLVEGATAHDKSGAAITGTAINTGNENYIWAKYAYGDIYEETKTELGSGLLHMARELLRLMASINYLEVHLFNMPMHISKAMIQLMAQSESMQSLQVR